MLEIRQTVYEFRSDYPLRLNQDVPTSTLRGAFGYAMADVLAYEHSLPIEDDKIALFKRYFAPSANGSNGAIRDQVRPFVLRGGFADVGRRSFRMQMLLFGQAAQLGALTDLVVERMATRGIGGGKHFGVPCRVARLDSSTIVPRFPEHVDRMVVEFLSATRIRTQGRWCNHEIPFAALASRLVDRFSELVHVYGEPDDRDWQQWAIKTKKRAQQVVSLLLDGGSTHARRRSTRTGQVCQLSGFVGRMLYQGDLRPFSEILAYLPFIHVGKSAPFGCGQCRITTGA